MSHTVRYFVYDADLDLIDDPDPIMEVSEREFIVYDGVIHYERHTMSQNGVSQICLTKYPEGF
jgi:hypothetical protein